MRGKLTDQDLTNYALNDGLDARERLYVESLLAVSEPCRQDVYDLIEVGQMMEEGFERDSDRIIPMLTADQRNRLLAPRRRHAAVGFLQRSAAAVALAACVAFALVNPRLWQGGAHHAHNLVKASSSLGQMVTASVTSGQDVDFSNFVDLHELVDDSSSWLQTASDALPQSATICTPPSWPDNTDFGLHH